MYNNVVDAIEAGYSAGGYTALRFNFRGVGESSGSYGEGEGETSDLVAAFTFLKEACKPGTHLALAGYSFGAWIAARALDHLTDVSSILLIALPVAIYGAGSVASFAGPIHLVAGAYDDIAFARDIQELYQRLASQDKHLKVIRTSHFFESREREITEFITETVIDRKREVPRES